MTFRGPSIASAVVLLSIGAQAWAQDDVESTFLSAKDCPELLGDHTDRAENKAQRQERLASLTKEPYAVSVVHQTNWETPYLMDLEGATLVGTVLSANEQPVAIIELALEDDPDFRCPAGTYEVRVDDLLGADVRVLGIVEDLVLVEHNHELAYLQPAEGSEPVWRMSWHAPFSIRRPPKNTRRRRPRTPTRRPRRKPRRR